MKEKTPMKTNVMRLLEQMGIDYTPHCYEGSGAISGEEVARVLGEPAEQVFKTLVTTAGGGRYYVFVVPAAATLHLKKAAAAVNEKSIEMIKQKELLPLTGYVHGGCSPVGMKKQFPTVVDETAQCFDTIFVSAGKIGYQVEIAPSALTQAVSAVFHDIV